MAPALGPGVAGQARKEHRMTFRDTLALNITPLLLRLALGVVFLWAGTAKLFYSNTATGDEAAMLANLGVIRAPALAPPPEAPPEAPPASPPVAPPAATPPSPTPTPAPPAATPPAERPAEPGAEPKEGEEPGAVVLSASAAAGGPYTGDQFPDAVTYKRLHSITLLLHLRSQPDANGHRLWPAELASPVMLRTMAWTAAVTEFFGGALVLIGFLTRLWALGLAGTMVTALLLTTVGPAAIGPSPFLGFLPDPKMSDPGAWVAAWQTMLHQFVLLMAALGLVLSGAGALSIDRLVFGARSAPVRARRDLDDE